MSWRQSCWWTHQRRPLPQRWVTPGRLAQNTTGRRSPDALTPTGHLEILCICIYISLMSLSTKCSVCSEAGFATAAPAVQHLGPMGGPCLSSWWWSLLINRKTFTVTVSLSWSPAVWDTDTFYDILNVNKSNLSAWHLVMYELSLWLQVKCQRCTKQPNFGVYRQVHFGNTALRSARFCCFWPNFQCCSIFNYSVRNESNVWE